MKATVIRDQFARLAGLEVDLDRVEPLPGGMLGWRTRINWAVAPDGTVGLHRHHSHEIEPIGHCPLGVPAVAGAPTGLPDGLTGCELVSVDEDGRGDPAVLARYAARGRRAPHGRRRPAQRIELIRGPRRVRRRLGETTFDLDPAGFWQVHPHALESFAEAVLDGLAPRPGERALDLYCGAGALTAALAHAVGPTGSVVGLESSRSAVRDARANLQATPWAEVRHVGVDERTLREYPGTSPRTHLVVLDPPRAGAGEATMRAVLAIGARAVGYVSCDPATLARDVRTAVANGWRLHRLRAFDAFPMTAHVECVAVLRPAADPATSGTGSALSI